MFKEGDRVTLRVNYPDDNAELTKGEGGTVLEIFPSRILVLWDTRTDLAESNDHLIEDYFDVYDHFGGDDDWAYNNTYFEKEGRLWYVSSQEIFSDSTRNFRTQKQNETELEYKIACKINELDTKWKERNANSNYIPVQNEQYKCSLPG